VHVIENWSGTHEVRPKVFFQPETEEELERIVAEAQEKGTKIRPMGSGLSPNGLSFQEEGMLSLALLDKVRGGISGVGQKIRHRKGL
jgi:L-galactono-1,4-lactone dehydrogenase